MRLIHWVVWNKKRPSCSLQGEDWERKGKDRVEIVRRQRALYCLIRHSLKPFPHPLAHLYIWCNHWIGVEASEGGWISVWGQRRQQVWMQKPDTRKLDSKAPGIHRNWGGGGFELPLFLEMSGLNQIYESSRDKEIWVHEDLSSCTI